MFSAYINIYILGIVKLVTYAILDKDSYVTFCLVWSQSKWFWLKWSGFCFVLHKLIKIII